MTEIYEVKGTETETEHNHPTPTPQIITFSFFLRFFNIASQSQEQKRLRIDAFDAFDNILPQHSYQYRDSRGSSSCSWSRELPAHARLLFWSSLGRPEAA